jgi:DNA polymerase-3 subunit epsilon
VTDFIAIDVETANPDMSSICQVGIAGFSDRDIAFEWKSLVDPEDWFSPFNINVHGITEDMVVGAPTLPELETEVRQYLEGRVVVCHTPFDRVSIHQAFTSYELVPPVATWLDSARVSRRTWSEVSQRSYGLASVCEIIGYEFAHHDALEDAKAAGRVLLAATDATGLTVDEWLVRVERPINPGTGAPITAAGNPDGPLYGEVMVFTGALEVPRREAAAIADRVGCRVDANVTEHTTLLVVGDQDVRKLAGHDKSSKHRKAEDMIASGHPLRILRETDFMRLVAIEESSDGS